MEKSTLYIKDFLQAVDRGDLGTMPPGFNDSSAVKALRDHLAEAEDFLKQTQNLLRQWGVAATD